MTTETKMLADLAKVMKRHKIEEYTTTTGAVIKLSPLALVEKLIPPQLTDKSKVVEDDLFYSSTNFKRKDK